MDAIVEALRTALTGRYVIQREIGRGGTASVWLAEDCRHRRAVAIKVLRPEIARSIGSARFLREIETAARLVHPRILPLHDSGDAGGLLYYVMPFVSGESLRDRLRLHGALPLGDAVGIATALAAALDYAHGQGVVHRDVKPENVLFVADEPMLADFGIARSDTGGSGALTNTGFSIGTPGYMSPEQVVGDREVDARTDIYALGCVLFEMLTGRPPFEAADAAALLRRHLTDEPPAPSVLRSIVPAELDAAVRRALAKSPTERFSSAAEFARALATGAAAGPAANAASARVMLAVLPFENRSADPEQEYFSDGLTDELIAQLGRLAPGRLGVIGRTSSMRYKRTQKTIPEIGRELRVSHVLGGSVRRAGDRVRITADLIQIHDQVQLWAETYERPLADVFALQTDVAQRVAAALTEQLFAAVERPPAPAEKPIAAPGPTRVDPAVSELYLRGRYAWRRHDHGSLQRARDCFRRAIELDPGFAPAHAGLAQTHLSLADQGDLPQPEASRLGIESARRAIHLDPGLAESYVALGHASIHSWDLDGADRALVRAIELNPSEPTAHAYRGYVQVVLGHPEVGRAAASIACQLDPFSMHVQLQRAEVLRISRRTGEAVIVAQAAVETDPDFAYLRQVLANAYLDAGRPVEALAEAQRFGSIEGHSPSTRRILATALIRLGRGAEAEEVMRQLEEGYTSGGGTSTEIAGAHVAFGRREKAIRWLERAYEERETDIAFLGVEAMWDPLRGDARFLDILHRAGIPMMATARDGGAPA
jgi:serine/threonine-protein kinase